MNGGPGIGRRLSNHIYIAARDPITDEAAFLMCLVAEVSDATWAYLRYDSIVLVGKNRDEERIRYRVLLTDDHVTLQLVPAIYATISVEDAKKYAHYKPLHYNPNTHEPLPRDIDFRGSIITKAEYDSYLEMKVLPHVRVGISQPKYPYL